MRKRIAALAAATGLAGLLVPLLAVPASAHEERTVGAYHFAVGFGDEPPYAGEKNNVQLILKDNADKPVTDLGDTLKVQVTTASQPAQKLDLALEPNFELGESGIPGDYRAWFIPTAPGRYTFRFTGTVKGQRVDQAFTSSKTGFDEVQDPAGVQFPVKEPSTGQLAGRLDRELPRLNAALAAQQRQARHEADQARTIAIVGVALGVLGVAGLVVGLLALTAARRAAGRGGRSGSSAKLPTGAGRT